MSFIRSAAITLTLAGTATLAGAATAFAAGGGPGIVVSPNPVTAGSTTTITAACGSDATAATISVLNGTFPMTAVANEQGVFQDVFSAADVPGTYTHAVHCNNGESGTATVHVVSATSPSAQLTAPNTGDGVTSAAAGGPFTAAGIALIGAGGLAAGAAAIRRRRRSGSPS